MGRPRECENVLSRRRNRILRKTSDRFSRFDLCLSPNLESPLLLAAIRDGTDAQLQSGRGSRLWVDDAFDFVAVSLAGVGDDGETVARRGTSCMAGLLVFCSPGESRLLCRALLPALDRRIATRRGCSMACSTSIGSMDTAHAAWQRPPFHRANHSSWAVLCRV